jgi:hypothetical protein
LKETDLSSIVNNNSNNEAGIKYMKDEGGAVAMS